MIETLYIEMLVVSIIYCICLFTVTCQELFILTCVQSSVPTESNFPTSTRNKIYKVCAGVVLDSSSDPVYCEICTAVHVKSRCMQLDWW